MRIRKLLGRTPERRPAPPPLSPWVSPATLQSSKESESRNDGEEEEMMAGFVNHVREAGEIEGADVKAGDEEEKKQGTVEHKRAVRKCKKTDGKGWHCKRHAQLPHTLCGYHLGQLRSYRGRSGDGERFHRHKLSEVCSAIMHQEDYDEEDKTEPRALAEDVVDDEKKRVRKPMKARSLKSLL